MLTIEKVLAGPQRSMLITSGGVFAWGNLEVLRTLPEGVDTASVCTTDATRIGHRSFAQPVPQRLSPRGTQWEGMVDAGHSLLAWSQGRVYALEPRVRDGEGTVPRPLAFGDFEVRRIWAGEQQIYMQDRSGVLRGWSDAMAGMAQPRRVQGLPRVRSVSVGMGHALALDAQGQVWSWGANAAGQLGLGDMAQRGVAQRVALPQAAVAVAAGATHSLALDDRGRLWGWGSNHHGQLDAGLQAPFSLRPTRIALPLRAASLAAGLHFSTVATAAGQVLAWGWNGLGQLGQGDAVPRPGFHVVPGPEAVRQISVGGTHVLALERSGRCWAWGDDRNGACQGADGVGTQSRPRVLALHALDESAPRPVAAAAMEETL